MNWYPDRLLVANVAGRALLSDAHIIGELRNDPWKGFDLPEGQWKRMKDHVYEESASWGGKVKPPRAIAELFRRFTADFPAPDTRVYRDEVIERIMPGETKARELQVFVGPEGRIHVDPHLLAALIKLIDGEPDEWRGSGANQPIHAVSSRGHWHGAIMPVRVS